MPLYETCNSCPILTAYFCHVFTFLYYDCDLGKDLLNVHVEVDWSIICVNVDFVVLIDRFTQFDHVIRAAG